MSDRSTSTFVISLTPFDRDGALDLDALAVHLDRLGRSGIGVYVGGSGSGEGYTLSRDERRAVFDTAVATLAGRVPVRAMGVEPRTAEAMIEMVADAAAAGLDAAQVYSLDLGHGYRPRPVELERYLHTVLEAVALPVVISTHQSVGYHYPVDLLAEVVDAHDVVAGLNVTSRDLSYLASVLDMVDGRVDVHVGGPAQALSVLALGGQGYLSSEGNLAPRLCVELIEAHRRADLAATHDAYRRVMALHHATQRLGGIVGTKAALRALGQPGGWPRAPRADVDDPSPLVELWRSLGLDATELGG